MFSHWGFGEGLSSSFYLFKIPSILSFHSTSTINMRQEGSSKKPRLTKQQETLNIYSSRHREPEFFRGLYTVGEKMNE